MPRPRAIITAFTVVLDGADAMAHAAKQASAFPLLKIKLGSREGVLADVTRLREIRQIRPDAKLIVDANEGWRAQELARYADLLAAHDVMFFEQPVAAREQGLWQISTCHFALMKACTKLATWTPCHPPMAG